MKKNYKLTFQLVTLTGILLIIIFGMIAFRNFQSNISKAAPYQTSLTPPYLRLTQLTTATTPPQHKTIAVLLNTNYRSTTAVDVTILFDANQLQIDSARIESTNAYSVIQKTLSPGEIQLSLFSNPDRAESLVITQPTEEIAIALLHFLPLIPAGNQSQLIIPFSPSSQSTVLIETTKERQSNPPNILEMTQGYLLKT